MWNVFCCQDDRLAAPVWVWTLGTETEINISMIPVSKFFHETHQIEPCISWWYFMIVFTGSSDFRSEVCWGQRDPWTPLPRVMGLEEFEVVKKLVELLES